MKHRQEEDNREANRIISRPREKSPTVMHGKVHAGQRPELALNAADKEGGDESETQEALERASRNGERKQTETDPGGHTSSRIVSGARLSSLPA